MNVTLALDHATALTPADPNRAARRDTRRAHRFLTVLRDRFPSLAHELPAGRRTAGTGTAAPPGAAALERQAARVLADRAGAYWNERRGLSGTAPMAAPVNLYVSDTIRDITDGVLELEDAVRAKLGLPRARGAAVPTRLERLSTCLDRIAEHPVLARHVADEARRMARRCLGALGEAESLVRVPGRCPHCASVSLRVAPFVGVVLCVNPGCHCDLPECACAADDAYRHQWTEGQWAGRDGALPDDEPVRAAFDGPHNGPAVR
ncbi:hypothetical protein OG948_12260 [Embleya sp. NBC_00888]|uniref:hypothetical protein n=1 Tax=Embleya sp. NBC_00888 TaxID=2975960 RepID=UPI00386E0B49|nr:hypothetical protein OG948_12260 [Embleya sp. NBC_00888]